MVLATAVVVVAAMVGPSRSDAVSLPSLPAGPALAATADPSWWVTNGRVDDIVTDGQSAWLAGGFDYLGPTTGHAVVTDPSSGRRTSPAGLQVDGVVEVSVADGAGGYYLAGSFARVGDLRRDGLAHVLPNGRLDRAFNPKVVGGIHAMVLSGGRLVIGGDITSVGATPVTRLAAVDTSGQLVAGWRATADGSVRALKQVGASLYVGGSFSTVDGVPRANLARLTLASGALEAFAPRTNGPVRAIDVVVGSTRDSDVVGVGGDFTTIATTAGTASRSRLASVTGAGSVLAWAPSVSGTVSALAFSPTGQQVAVGGGFTSIAGVPRTGVAVLGLDGSVGLFDARLVGCQLPHTVKNTNQLVPCPTGATTVAWSAAGSTLYLGGLFTTTQGALRHNVAAYDVASGAVTAWSPMPSATVLTVNPMPQGVVVGGKFTSTGGVYRQSVAKIDLSTGRADPWFAADTDNMVLDLELDPARTSLFLAGSFRTVDGVTRNKVAKVSARTGALDTSFTVGANKDVQSIAVRGDSLYLGGLFTKIGQDPRSHAAKASAVTGAADPTWRADTSGPGGVWKGGAVFSVAVSADASRAFLAGGFTTVNGQSVDDGIIAVDGLTGAVNPSRLGGLLQLPTVRCASSFMTNLQLSDDGKRLYGGDLCPDGIYAWDAVGLATTRPDGLLWTTWCNGGMQGKLEVGGRFYFGSHGGDRGRGGFCWVSPSNRTSVVASRAMAFSTGSGELEDWAPFFDSPMGVWAYAVVPQGLLVGGDFTVAGDRSSPHQGLALFRGTP
ncbi:hypothetical protein V3N99_05200 [Dermatophilaceae bacterium Soc4.6]